MRSGRLADLECHRLLRTRNFDREWAWPTKKRAWFQNFRARDYMNPPSQNPRSATGIVWVADPHSKREGVVACLYAGGIKLVTTLWRGCSKC